MVQISIRNSLFTFIPNRHIYYNYIQTDVDFTAVEGIVTLAGQTYIPELADPTSVAYNNLEAQFCNGVSVIAGQRRY